VVTGVNQINGFTSSTSASAMSRRHEEMFTQMDTNGDGSIDKAEFTAFGQQMANQVNGPDRSEEIFSEIDANSDGSVDKAEFTAFGEKMAARAKPQDNSEDIFSQIDTNGDGTISQAEFTAFGQQMADKVGDSDKSEEIFALMDTDGDGLISKAEAEAGRARIENQMKLEMTEQMSASDISESDGLASLLDILEEEDQDTQSLFDSAIRQYASSYQQETQSTLQLLG
jgi:Ca2+-binding EF-hand superfamily protein